MNRWEVETADGKPLMLYGNSAEEIGKRYTDMQDKSELTAGLMWHPETLPIEYAIATITSPNARAEQILKTLCCI